MWRYGSPHLSNFIADTVYATSFCRVMCSSGIHTGKQNAKKRNYLNDIFRLIAIFVTHQNDCNAHFLRDFAKTPKIVFNITKSFHRMG